MLLFDSPLDKTVKLNKLKNIIQINKGLGDKETVLKIFDRDGASFLSDEGQGKVDVTTIDSFAKKNNLNIGLIKMDIEGYEFKAVRGATSTIKNFKPVMLISLYHRGEDFFEIKPFIEDITENQYKFKIRNLNPFVSFHKETMLICSPKIKQR